MQYGNYMPALDRVSGIDEARRYKVMQGQTVYLLDNDSPMVYMKSDNGLRAFSLTEIDPSSITDPRYVSKADFESFRKEMIEAIKGGIKQ